MSNGTIIVQWIKDDGTYGREMKVLSSDHDRFTVGSMMSGFMIAFFDMVMEIIEEGKKI